MKQNNKAEEEGTEMKECCKECGFPIDMERNPVIIKNSAFSFFEYENERCSCGHQRNGWNIPVVYDNIVKIREEAIKEKEKEIRNKIFQEIKKEFQEKGMITITRVKDFVEWYDRNV